MRYAFKLDTKYEKPGILSRIREATYYSPIELFTNRHHQLLVVFGRCVESNRWKKSKEYKYLATVDNQNMMINNDGTLKVLDLKTYDKEERTNQILAHVSIILDNANKMLL